MISVGSLVTCPLRYRIILLVSFFSCYILVCLRFIHILNPSNSIPFVKTSIRSYSCCQTASSVLGLDEILRKFLNSTQDVEQQQQQQPQQQKQRTNNCSREDNDDDGDSETRSLRDFMCTLLRVYKERSMTDNQELAKDPKSPGRHLVCCQNHHGGIADHKHTPAVDDEDIQQHSDAITTLQNFVNNFTKTRHIPEYKKNTSFSLHMYSNDSDRQVTNNL